MRRYLLDTSILGALFNNRPGAVRLIDPWLDHEKAATSILVYGELTEYLRGVPDFTRRHGQLRTLLDAVYPYFLTYRILDRYGEIRRALRPLTQMIGDVDTLIAATALERNLTVVTLDQHYARVPGLSVHLLTHADLA